MQKFHIFLKCVFKHQAAELETKIQTTLRAFDTIKISLQETIQDKFTSIIILEIKEAKKILQSSFKENLDESLKNQKVLYL